jgi:hypothetical protein
MRALRSEARLMALNPGLFRSDPALGTASATRRWVAAGLAPFLRDSMLEIPLYTPLDCDLLGFPDPCGATPKPLLEFAEFALRQTPARPTALTMLTFHDWIIAGGNRLALLDHLLSSLDGLALRAATVEQSWDALLALASAGGAGRREPDDVSLAASRAQPARLSAADTSIRGPAKRVRLAISQRRRRLERRFTRSSCHSTGIGSTTKIAFGIG